MMFGNADLGKIKQKFLDHSEFDGFPATACRVWTGGKTPNGYGSVWIDNKNHTAHRVAFAIANGWLPSIPQLVLHKCNNKRCIRVDHLYCGDAKDNHIDFLRTGVDWGRKITKLLAGEILWLTMNRPDLTYDEIGERYNTTKTSVWLIKHGLKARFANLTPVKPDWPRKTKGFNRRF
jgi:hypothetical protein